MRVSGSNRAGREAATAVPVRRRPMLAALILLAAWGPASAAIVLTATTQSPWEPVSRLVVTALVYAPTASIVQSIGQRAVAAVLTALAVASGVSALTKALLTISSARLPGEPLVMLDAVSSYAMHLAELSALGMLIWLLGGHPLRRVGLALGWAAILLDIVLAVAGRIGAVQGAAMPPVHSAPLLLALGGFLFGAVATLGRWRGAWQAERIVPWFCAGAALMVVSYLYLIPGLAEPAGPTASASAATFIAAQSLLPTAVLAAVFGGSGAIIDRRLVTGLIWAQSLACAIALYVLVDAAMLALGLGATLAGGLAAAVLALVFSLMLGVFRDFTETAFFGPGGSVRRVLARLGEPASSGAGEGGLAGMAQALREVWHLRSVSILATDGSRLAQTGDDGEAAVSYDLVSGRRSVGTIRCTADEPAALSNIVAPMLDQIGGLLGAAVQLAIANQDLASLRERTREVSREERRLLHGELHDELAPALTGIGFAIAGARRLVSGGSPAASDALDRLQAETAETTGRVRRLARALLPAALDAGDLDGALRELAARFSGPEFSVTASARGTDRAAVDAGGPDDSGRYGQLTAYLVLADAVEILSREGRARSVHLEASLGEGAIVIALRTEPARGERIDAALESISLRCAEAGGLLVAPGEQAADVAPRAVIPL